MKGEEFKDDSSIVEACIKRDLVAWSTFINKYSSLIEISIKNRLKRYGCTLPDQDVEDVRQDILASLWKERKFETIKNRHNITYWLAIVSGNMAVEYLRQKLILEPLTPMSIFEKIGEKELSELIPSSEPKPSDDAAKNEFLEKVEAAVELLPGKERLITKLNLLYDKKYHEIADMLGIPRGTVSSYLKRAKERLKERLKDFR